MIKLYELILNHKHNTDIAGLIQKAFKERQNTIKYKKKDTKENLFVEVAALGIFDRLRDNDIKKITQKIVEENSLNIDFHQLKSDAIQQAIALNQHKKEQEQKQLSKNINIIRLLTIREYTIKKKKHPYELLKVNGYIQNPLEESY